MECKPEESIVSEEKLQTEAEALSALQHTQVREVASPLDAQ